MAERGHRDVADTNTGFKLNAWAHSTCLPRCTLCFGWTLEFTTLKWQSIWPGVKIYILVEMLLCGLE